MLTISAYSSRAKRSAQVIASPFPAPEDRKMIRIASIAALLASSPLFEGRNQTVDFRDSLRGSAYMSVLPGMPVGGVIAPTKCRVEARPGGGVRVVGPGASGALTCQLVLSWSQHPLAASYQTAVTVPAPCARARGATVGATSEILAFVVSPYSTCDIRAVVFAIDSSRAARIDSTKALVITAAGAD